MTFNPNARLDPSQVEDARGGGFPGGRLAIGGGGGVIGILALVIYLLFGGSSSPNPNDLNVLLGQQVGAGAQPADSPLAGTCQTGADANTRQDCAIIG